MDGLNRHKRGVGERIKSLRGGLSQTAFAAQLKISLPALQRYEYGDRIPRGPVLERMEQISGRSVDWILTGKDRMSDIVAEGSAPYGLDDVTQKVLQMMARMDVEDKREVLKYASFRKQGAKKKLKEG